MLGVGPDAGPDEIRRAYRRLARRWHPDLAGAEGVDRMRRLNEAMAVLSDPGARRRYDAATRRSSPPSARPFVADPTGVWSPPVDPAAGPSYRPGGAARLLTTLAPVALVGSLLTVGLGLFLVVPGLVVLGVVGLALAVAAFLAAPLVVMGAARGAERRR